MSAIEDHLEVYVSCTGQVCIAQRDMSEDCYVAIPPEDVEQLIGWLRAKADEAIALARTNPPEPAFTD